MHRALPAVLETSESQSSLSPKRDRADSLITGKSSVQSSNKSTIWNIIQNKKELDTKVSQLKSKVKKLELNNIRSIRTAENLKKKNEDLLAVRREFENFKYETEKIKKEVESSFESRKKKLKEEKIMQKENLQKSKENVHKRVLQSKNQVLKERRENEEYIKRRDAFHKQQAKELVMNMTSAFDLNKHQRAKSALNAVENKENEYQEELLSEIKQQQTLLQKLEHAAKEEENILLKLRIHRTLSKSPSNISQNTKDIALPNKKESLTECKFLLTL